jgi:large subunit ribosomal protein L9
MKVVLHADVDSVGHRGDIVDVSPGYARNYLVPKGLAQVATDGAKAQADAMRRARDIRDAADRGAAEEVASKLVPQVITVAARAHDDGQLYGSVTATEIAEAVTAQTGIELDRRQISLSEPIKETGTHLVPAKLHSDVEFPITVEVQTA